VLALRDLIVRQAPVGAAARDLYDLLVKPAEAQLAGRRRLLIVPDGALWALPIQALQPRDGRYVIEDYAVAYGASLTAIVAMNRTDKLTRAPASPAKRLVAVGLGEPDKTALEELALLRPDLRFEPLRYAEAEGRAVTAGLPSGAGILLTGRDARQSRVVAEARGATTLHLAVPGVLNDASPTHSLLAFAPGNDNCDCLVDTSMVMALDQSATVVVLSRLYGEPGQLGPGAGVTMMAWAWFVAGAPTTVLTQWLVDAPSTNTLMAGFHRSLATPPAGGAHPASAALQRATLQLLRGQAVHPFYWAGFVVMGDAR
jgi:CHAT domain-containing protein